MADPTSPSIRLSEGKIYCCVVLDLFSRKVVGWAIDRRCESALVIDAYQQSQGLEGRRHPLDDHPLGPRVPFTSWTFTESATPGLVGSMGTVGDCFDNAPMESFWGSMQIELLNRQR